MNDTASSAHWWQLHLRKARGEPLSAEENEAYLAELTRQDRAAPALIGTLGPLRTMRAEMAELAQANVDLRSRLSELDLEIRLVEKSMSHETREALGVKE